MTLTLTPFSGRWGLGTRLVVELILVLQVVTESSRREIPLCPLPDAIATFLQFLLVPITEPATYPFMEWIQYYNGNKVDFQGLTKNTISGSTILMQNLEHLW